MEIIEKTEDERYLKAIKEVLAGKGLNETSRQLGLNQGTLSIAVRFYRIFNAQNRLNTSLNAGSSQKVTEVEELDIVKVWIGIAVAFFAGFLVGILIGRWLF